MDFIIFIVLLCLIYIMTIFKIIKILLFLICMEGNKLIYYKLCKLIQTHFLFNIFCLILFLRVTEFLR